MSGAPAPFDSYYPPGPASVPTGFTEPTPAYRRHAWIASGVLLLFVAAYLSLTGWFVWAGYRHLLSLGSLTEDSFSALVKGGCAVFMAVFMLKALVFVSHRDESSSVEVTAADQPRLFQFLHRLADEAGAPRPNRVFLSPSVNAAVFYDLSILNLLFPSRKNLDIGLGLVNVLTLDEFKAVCAHEFGHFAQRTMAVGRWVYTSQQIAVHIIAKRDFLDRVLSWLNGFDFRIAWIGWILSLIIWSIRSLAESAFKLVILAHRALSREMELQADLVAVSLTGSDSLIYALHKLQAADDAWDGAVRFATQQAVHEKQKVRDMFSVQSRILDRMRVLLGDPAYGVRPPGPAAEPRAHRVFRAELAQPPRMWSTHPPNDEREENAKRTYLPAPADARPAWEIFDKAQELREKLSDGIVRFEDVEPTPQEPAESERRIDRQFTPERFAPAYRGVYFARSAVLPAESPDQLYDPVPAEVTVADLDSLYPASLAAEIEELRGLSREKVLLEALRSGELDPPNGVIRHRGRHIRKAELPAAIESVRDSIRGTQARLTAHDRRCRTVHRALARRLHEGWEPYLVSLGSLVHFAEHSAANVADAYLALTQVVSVEAATGRVRSEGLDLILVEARDVHRTLDEVHQRAASLEFDDGVKAHLPFPSLREALIGFDLPLPDNANIAEWLKAAESWVRVTGAVMEELRDAALERLLHVESTLAAHLRGATLPEPAPAPCRVSAGYRALTPGSERPKESKLGWWARFQTASGAGPAIARTGVAAAIVGAVLLTGSRSNRNTIYVYNGLERVVAVTVQGQRVVLESREHESLTVEPADTYSIAAHTTAGQEIESVEQAHRLGEWRHVYSVAGAAPMGGFKVVYGDGPPPPAPTKLGAPQWLATRADFVFQSPPRSASLGRSKFVTREALLAPEAAPGQAFQWVEEEAARRRLALAHARWDLGNTPHIMDWIQAGYSLAPDQIDSLLAERLREFPGEVVAMRAQQDINRAQQTRAACDAHTALASAKPDDADLQYLAARCIESDEGRNRAFATAGAKWPKNTWLAFANAHTLAESENWNEAAGRFGVALANPALARNAAENIARLRGLAGLDVFGGLDGIASHSPQLLGALYKIVKDITPNSDDKETLVYRALVGGQLDQALALSQGLADEARIVRFIAASRGQTPHGVMQRALNMPVTDGVDTDSVWPALGLAIRNGKDPEALWQEVAKFGGAEFTQSARRFVQFVRAGDFKAATAESRKHTDLRFRAQFYVLGIVLSSGKVPREWVEFARGALFPFERPFL